MPPKPAGPSLSSLLLPKRAPLKIRAIPNVQHLIPVWLGKGGPDKSTLATNIAFALALRKERSRVGLLGRKGKGKEKRTERVNGEEEEGEDFLKAQATSSGALKSLMVHGLPVMLMGSLVPPGSPIVWRGLMVQKAIQQLLFDVDWPSSSFSSSSNAGLDIPVMDLPPGTGDVPLFLAQLVSLDGTVIVFTPRAVSLANVRKGIKMFKKLKVPIPGMVSNQAYYQCPTCGAEEGVYSWRTNGFPNPL